MENYYRLKFLDRGEEVTKYLKANDKLVPDIDVLEHIMTGSLAHLDKITKEEYEKHMLNHSKPKPRHRRDEPRVLSEAELRVL